MGEITKIMAAFLSNRINTHSYFVTGEAKFFQHVLTNVNSKRTHYTMDKVHESDTITYPKPRLKELIYYIQAFISNQLRIVYKLHIARRWTQSCEMSSRDSFGKERWSPHFHIVVTQCLWNLITSFPLLASTMGWDCLYCKEISLWELYKLVKQMGETHPIDLRRADESVKYPQHI